MRIPRFLALLSLAALILCAASFADTILSLAPFNNSDIGLTAAFSNGIASVTVSGFSANNTTTQIYSKNGGGTADEYGLGLDDGDVDHEISGSAFIQLTASGIDSVAVGSIQSGESFTLYGSNTPGQLGGSTDILATQTGGETANIMGLLALTSGKYNFIDLYSPSGNVLLNSLDTPDARVPEPGTTAMIMTLGLVGLFEVGRRKLMA